MAATDPRLAALYDTDNPDGPDHDYFRAVADRIDARTIIDLGCGTGILTVTLAGEGRRSTFAGEERRVIGIDPDDGMLEIARHRPGTERVQWISGDSRAIGDARADLIVMTGNVAQHIAPDDWERTLGDIAAGLRPGGLVSFESRNPDARGWEAWTKPLTYSERETAQGKLIEWLETSGPDQHNTIMLIAHNHWVATGEELVVTQPLTFRSAEQITADLAAVGLTVTSVAGGWEDEPVLPDSRLFVFEATKPAQA